MARRDGWRRQIVGRAAFLMACAGFAIWPCVNFTSVSPMQAPAYAFFISLGFLLVRLRQRVWAKMACWRAVGLALGAGILAFLLLTAVSMEMNWRTVLFLLFWSCLALPPVALFVLLPDEQEEA